MENNSTEENVGCQHYKRNCKLLAPCCNKVGFTFLSVNLWCYDCLTRTSTQVEPSKELHNIKTNKKSQNLIYIYDICSLLA